MKQISTGQLNRATIEALEVEAIDEVGGASLVYA